MFYVLLDLFPRLRINQYQRIEYVYEIAYR